MTVIYGLLRNLVGFLYPSYKAFKTLYHPDPTRWESFIEHFVVLSCFMACELVSDLVLFWIPFYESLKLLLVIWLSVPFFGGAHLMYENYIWPTLPLYEAQIDIQVLRLKRLTRAYFIRLGRELLHSLHVFLTESINIANDGSGGNSEEIIHHDSPGESASPWSGTHATKAPSPRVRRRSLLQYKGLPSLPSKKIRDPISLPLNARPHGAHPNSQFQRSRSFSAGPAYS